MPQLIAPPEDHLYYAYGTLLMSNRHRFVRKLQKNFEPSIHGHKPWDSSFLLMDYLAHHKLLKPRQKVLELGCGWGAASIHCARLYQSKVTGLDRDPDVFPYLEVQAALNDVNITTREASFEDVNEADLKSYHLILGADICFWDSLIKPLQALVARAASAGVKYFLLADPGRPPFHQLCKKLLKHYEGEQLDWYALEPKRADGELLVLRLQD